jgi:hypothetical protein
MDESFLVQLPVSVATRDCHETEKNVEIGLAAAGEICLSGPLILKRQAKIMQKKIFAAPIAGQ